VRVTTDNELQQPASRRARPIERVRGTHDRLPVDATQASTVQDDLFRHARSHGYERIETPVLEHTELFLRKSGGDRLAQLYAFEHRGRDLALRPEFTASAMRLYIERLQGEPLPIRLSYAGPVFRYEKPQAGRARQFTEFGCELIGASGPVADAEIITLALDGLRLAGIERPRLVLGHIGVVINFLGGLDIDQRAQDWLTWSMERLRKGDDRAHDLPPHLERLEAEMSDPSLPVIADQMSAETAASLLRQAGVQFQGGARTPEDIVRGLFRKQRQRYDAALLREAADFVERLTQLTGPPEVLAALRDLVSANGLDTGPLDELGQIVALLASAGCATEDVKIDLGMGRGLHYYTGMLFEVYDDSGGPQLCGGGRYDDLAQVLGAREPVPACGFSYGVERVLAASSRDGTLPRLPSALVRQNGDPARAMQLARELRRSGWAATIDLRDRNASATRRAAERQGYRVIANQTPDGVEVLDLASGSVTRYAAPPAPDEALAP
jgi:histidyl-tRNA synthetase